MGNPVDSCPDVVTVTQKKENKKENTTQEISNSNNNVENVRYEALQASATISVSQR